MLQVLVQSGLPGLSDHRPERNSARGEQGGEHADGTDRALAAQHHASSRISASLARKAAGVNGLPMNAVPQPASLFQTSSSV